MRYLASIHFAYTTAAAAVAANGERKKKQTNCKTREQQHRKRKKEIKTRHIERVAFRVHDFSFGDIQVGRSLHTHGKLDVLFVFAKLDQHRMN